MNEAALLAARRKATVIAKEDLDEAVEKVVAGPERNGLNISQSGKERRRSTARIAAHSS